MSTESFKSINVPYQVLDQNFEDHESLKPFQIDHTSTSSLLTTRTNLSKNVRLFSLLSFVLVAAAIFTLLSGYTSFLSSGAVSGKNSGSFFDDRGRYVMKNYDELKPMSSFLAGIGGPWGIPLWAFYVNRGQGITSFGIQNKDNAIAKFNTADKAYQQTPFTGFRTFIRGSRLGAKFNHMPFFPLPISSKKAGIERNMMIGMNEMEIEEIVPDLNLKTSVLYFTVPNEDFPALVRRTTFTNTDDKSTLEIDVLDGLARLVPSGLNNGVLDAMGRTMEAWMNVFNAAVTDGVRQPFFHISQGTADTAQVQVINDGHFAIAFIEDSKNSSELRALLPFIVDPNVVFDTDTTLSHPKGFFDESAPAFSNFMSSPQGTTSRTPCSYAGAQLKLLPGESITITSVYGHAEDLQTFVGKYSPAIQDSTFVSRKYAEAHKLTESITERVKTKSASPLFDAYVQQDFLDNVLRGGLPLILGDPTEPKIYHTFSRIHGDIERDYNFFQIDTTYFSQGPGNFRDVNQNRRMDIFHTPQVGDFNVHMFLSFIQSDGYNPLTVATCNFKVPLDAIDGLVTSLAIQDNEEGKYTTLLKGLLAKPFRLGELFKNMKLAGIQFAGSKEEILHKITVSAEQHTAGQYAQNGYWADHWTYTFDLVENYLSIFPDREESLMWDSDPVPFYMSPAVVRPRVDRYSIVDNPLNPGTSTVRVYRAVSSWGDPDHPAARVSAMGSILSDSDYVVDSAGAGAAWQKSKDGDVVTVSSIAKLLILVVLKFSTLDPLGMGVEMEGGKPGWNDAMNGLPGLVGSGMPETYEALRIVQYLKKTISRYQRGVIVPTEFGDLIDALSSIHEEYISTDKSSSVAENEFLYWNSSNNAREAYREKLVGTFDGAMVTVSPKKLLTFIDAMNDKMTAGISRALATSPSGMSPTYFYYECLSYEWFTWVGPNKIMSKEFKLHTLPLFLEGPTRHFKVVSSIEEKRDIYRKVRQSVLYDERLQMYTMSASLKAVGQEVGRMKAFSPGWLENESVWLHMSYKFYLELLRGGLYKEFFDEIATGLVPFMKNDIYGRSPIEAASFIVSSAFPDPKLHGAGFLARLSGSTAEFLSMWAIMMAGEKPFILDADGKLSLSFKPVLPSWLFTEEGTVSFTFLGSVEVTYINPKKANTWEMSPHSAIVTDSSGHNTLVDGAIFGEILSRKVRDGEIEAIKIQY